MDCAEVGGLEEINQEGLGGSLDALHGRALPAELGSYFLRDFANKSLKWQFSDKQLGAFLVLADLTKRDSTRAVAVGQPHQFLASRAIRALANTDIPAGHLFKARHTNKKVRVSAEAAYINTRAGAPGYGLGGTDGVECFGSGVAGWILVLIADFYLGLIGRGMFRIWGRGLDFSFNRAWLVGSGVADFYLFLIGRGMFRIWGRGLDFSFNSGFLFGFNRAWLVGSGVAGWILVLIADFYLFLIGTATGVAGTILLLTLRGYRIWYGVFPAMRAAYAVCFVRAMAAGGCSCGVCVHKYTSGRAWLWANKKRDFYFYKNGIFNLFFIF